MPNKIGREKAMRLAQMAINETGGMGSMARKKRAMELAETGGPGGLNVGFATDMMNVEKPIMAVRAAPRLTQAAVTPSDAFNLGMEAVEAAPRLTQAAANAPIGVDTPMGPMGTPAYMQERTVVPMAPPPIEELTQGQSAKLAEIRANPAFDLGFREGIEDYQNLKLQTDDILDELAGSIDGAKSARTNVFLGNMTTADIRRLGYAEAMEFAEREENNREQKILRQGMMER